MTPFRSEASSDGSIALNTRKLYRTKHWKIIRARQLVREPLCEWCFAKKISRAAYVVHHAEPHRGNERKFYTGKLVSLCPDCHDRVAQGIEVRGYSHEIDIKTGWPSDPDHPANKGRD